MTRTARPVPNLAATPASPADHLPACSNRSTLYQSCLPAEAARSGLPAPPPESRCSPLRRAASSAQWCPASSLSTTDWHRRSRAAHVHLGLTFPSIGSTFPFHHLPAAPVPRNISGQSVFSATETNTFRSS